MCVWPKNKCSTFWIDYSLESLQRTLPTLCEQSIIYIVHTLSMLYVTDSTSLPHLKCCKHSPANKYRQSSLSGNIVTFMQLSVVWLRVIPQVLVIYRTLISWRTGSFHWKRLWKKRHRWAPVSPCTGIEPWTFEIWQRWIRDNQPWKHQERLHHHFIINVYYCF